MIAAFKQGIEFPSFDTILTEAPPIILLAKVVGALAGTMISIAYILPRGRREAWLRMSVGMVSGLIFGGTAGVKLGDMLGLLDKVSPFEITLTGATVASLSACWGLGVVERIAERMPGWNAISNGLSERKREKK